jgi:CRP-like cAMP-binding protein
MPSPKSRAARHRDETAGFRAAAKGVRSQVTRDKVLTIAQGYQNIATNDEGERLPVYPPQSPAVFADRFLATSGLGLAIGGALASESAPLFDPESFLAKAGHGHSLSEYGGGSTIFAQGDPADDLFFIKKGSVKITVVSRRGKEAVVGILPAGRFFGEAVLTGQQVRVATASAVEQSSIARISKATMICTLHEQPAFSEFFIGHLLSRNQRIEEDLVDQLFNSSEKRLARILLLLANFGKEGKPETVIPSITQETLAEMVGTTRSRVSFFMNKFRKLGFIEYNGKLKIHSSLLNVVLHD